MASFKHGNLKERFEVVVTSNGTTTLLNNSKKYQILTGAQNHTVRLPNATTMVNGLSFVIINESTGTVSVQYNDTTSLVSVPSNASVALLLQNNSTSNGTWAQTGGGGEANVGLAGQTPGSSISADYTIQTSDDGRTLLIDTSSSFITLTLPAPSAGFKVTVKDANFNSGNNNILVLAPVGVEIDSISNNVDIINSNGACISYVSDGTSYYRSSSFKEQNGSKAVVVGGYNSSFVPIASTNYFNIATLGNALSFGSLNAANSGLVGASSNTRGIIAGGTDATGSVAINTIDYLTIASLSAPIDFGDLTVARYVLAGLSNSVKALFGGGRIPATSQNTIDYIFISTLGNATDFGDLYNDVQAPGALASTTRGLFFGGDTTSTNTYRNNIGYVEIATASNTSAFGNLLDARAYICGTSSNTRGIIAGGTNGVSHNVIQYVTIASLGNAIDFGDLSAARNAFSATSNKIRAVFSGGDQSGTIVDTIEYVTIASLGNAIDFGNLTTTEAASASFSDSHGGLA